MEALTIDQINRLYPGEWVVIGCTCCENEETKEGVVIAHSQDAEEIYRFLVQHSSAITSQFPYGISIRHANIPPYSQTEEGT